MEKIDINSAEYKAGYEAGESAGYDKGYEDGYNAGEVKLEKYGLYSGKDKDKLAIAKEIDNQLGDADGEGYSVGNPTLGKVLKWVILGTLIAIIISISAILLAKESIISHNKSQIEALKEQGYTYEDMVVRVEDKIDIKAYPNEIILKLKVYDYAGRLEPFWILVTEELYTSTDIGDTVTIPAYINGGSVKVLGEKVGIADKGN